MKTKLFLPFLLIFFAPGIFSQNVSKNVIISDDSVYMEALGRYTKLRIYLPPNYHESNQRYPVLYMTDAQNLFDPKTSYAGEWGVDEILDSLYKADGFELIVVGIDHAGAKRLNEYSPWDNKKYGKGEGKAFAEYLTSDLKPMIDKTYRTLSDAEHTGIMGSSLGGFIAHYLLFEYPNVFNKAGIFSPSYWYAREVFPFTESKNYNDSLRFLILIEGEKTSFMGLKVLKMEKLLQKVGYTDKQMQVIYDEKGKHNETFWRSYFAQTIQFLFY